MKNTSKQKCQIIEKAYIIDLSKVDEGFVYDANTCAATGETSGKAKAKLMQAEGQYMQSFATGEYFTFLTLPIVRSKEHDIVLFDGVKMKRRDIDSFIALNERKRHLESILQDPSVTHCYIKKRGEYYRPNNCGYTSFICFAGVYEKAEAVNDARACEDLYIEPINTAEHNAMIDRQVLKILANKIVTQDTNIS